MFPILRPVFRGRRIYCMKGRNHRFGRHRICLQRVTFHEKPTITAKANRLIHSSMNRTMGFLSARFARCFAVRRRRRVSNDSEIDTNRELTFVTVFRPDFDLLQTGRASPPGILQRIRAYVLLQPCVTIVSPMFPNSKSSSVRDSRAFSSRPPSSSRVFAL